MLQVDERCYTGIMTKDGAVIHFFDGENLDPVAPERAYACPLGWSYGAERVNSALSIIADYIERTGSLRSPRALAEAFATQFFSTLDRENVLFIEEHRIQDWLRVMHMLEVA